MCGIPPRVLWAGAFLSCALLSAPSVAAQRHPSEAASTTAAEQNASFHKEIRQQITVALQEWANVWERGQAELLARYYTDEAVVLTAEGASRGRAAIGAMWQAQLPTVSDLRVELAEVLPASSLAVATGRVSYLVTPADAPSYPQFEHFVMVFDDQRGHWMIRAQAFAPTAGTASGRAVIRPNRRAARPPAMVAVRMVGEVFGGRSAAAGPPEAPAWDVVGGGLGLELGRLLELRGHAWQEMGGGSGEDPLRSYAGEMRVHFASLWRLRPNVSLGAGRITGSMPQEQEVLPVLGGGLGIAVNDALRVQFAARNYLPRRPGQEQATWIQAARDQRWLFSGGLSVAVGRDRTWSDPPRSPLQLEYEATAYPPVARALGEWLRAVQGSDPQALGSLYTLGAVLLVPGEQTHRTQEAIQRYWQENGSLLRNVAVTTTDLRISGNVAVVTAQLDPRGGRPAADPHPGAGQLVTVLDRSGGAWKIRAQALTAPTTRTSLSDASSE